MRFGRLAFALVLAATQPVLAQTVSEQPAQAPNSAPTQGLDPGQRFQAYVTSEGYKSMLAQLAVMGETVSAPECKDHAPKERAGLTVYGPPLFEAGPHPVAGLWVDRIRMDRCGTTSFQNVLLQAQKDGTPPRAALLMPGSTMTNPPMQKLIMTDVLAGLEKKCPDQAKIIPVLTKMEKESTPLKVDEKGMITQGAWKETWTFKACGKTVNATIELSANGKGTLNHKVKL
jgi:hypothetical protein